MEYWTSVANQHSAYWFAPSHPVVPPGPEQAEAIAEAYWTSLSESLHGAVRAEGAPLGPACLAVARVGTVILAFGEAVVEAVPDGVEIAFPIVGGAACSGAAGELRLIARA